MKPLLQSAPTNDSAKAARLLAAAASTRERTGGRLSASEQAAFDDLVVVVRNRLEPAEFALACQTGHEMTLDNAVADALAWMAAR